jgi:hypothetical protein
MNDTASDRRPSDTPQWVKSPKLAPLIGSRGSSDFIRASGPSPHQQAGHMTEGRQPFTAEIKTLAKGPSTYDPLENAIRRLQPAGMRKNRSFRERHSERSSRTAA